MYYIQFKWIQYSLRVNKSIEIKFNDFSIMNYLINIFSNKFNFFNKLIKIIKAKRPFNIMFIITYNLNFILYILWY